MPVSAIDARYKVTNKLTIHSESPDGSTKRVHDTYTI